MGIQGQEGLGRRSPTPIVGSTPTGQASQEEGLVRLSQPSVAQLDRAPASGLSRRGFLETIFVGGVAAAAAERSWPFRVFSFPTVVVKPATLGPVIAEYCDYIPFSVLAVIYYDKKALKCLQDSLPFEKLPLRASTRMPAPNLFRYEVVQ